MKIVPLLVKGGFYLEARNAADEPLAPGVQLKTGEDAREAAKRAVDEFYGLAAPDAALLEGFQLRVADEIVQVIPVDTTKIEMSLLRPAEEVATWAWRDVPKSMGHVPANGYPRNQPRYNNVADAVEDAFGARAGAGVARRNGGDLGEMAQVMAAKLAEAARAPAAERPRLLEEIAQEFDDLRLLTADAKAAGERLNSVGRKNSGDPVTARAAVVNSQGQMLAARQKDGRSLLPGGHIEAGETPEAAMRRELLEETGLDVGPGLTGQSYEFDGDDGSRHVAFLIDADKLDLSKLAAGDDVADVEVVNSPFTDSHGVTHPQRAADAAEIGRHLEGIAHEVGEMERNNHDPLDAKTKTMILDWLQKHHGDREGLAVWMRDSLRLGPIGDCRALITEAIEGKSRNNHIEKLADGKYRLLSHEGKNLGTFDSHAEAAKHEGEVEWFKEHKNALEASGHVYAGKREGPFHVLRCNSLGAETVAAYEGDKRYRCEGCGEVLPVPLPVGSSQSI